MNRLAALLADHTGGVGGTGGTGSEFCPDTGSDIGRTVLLDGRHTFVGAYVADGLSDGLLMLGRDEVIERYNA